MALKLTDSQLDWLVERIPEPVKSPLGGRRAAAATAWATESAEKA